MKQTPKEYVEELVQTFELVPRKHKYQDEIDKPTAIKCAIECVERIIEAKPIRIDKSGLVLSNIDYYNQVLTELKTKTD